MEMKKASYRIVAIAIAAVLVLTGAGLGLGFGLAAAKHEKISIFSRPTVQKIAGQKKDWNDVDSFTCYYGPLTGIAEPDPVYGGDLVPVKEALKDFDVAIIHSNQMFGKENAKEIVQEIRDSGTYVIAYITVGEDDTLRVADGLGEGGYASYYIYEDGVPKTNAAWGSYYVDAGNPVWQAIVLEQARKIMEYDVDGFFLDTLDTVYVEPTTMGGMQDLCRRLDEAYPEAKIVANRGFTAFPYISQYLDGIMFEYFSMNYNETTKEFYLRDEKEMMQNYVAGCNLVNRARRYDYMPVFVLDYVEKDEYKYMSQICFDEAWKFDFITYTTYSRALEICPVPGVKPKTNRGELALKYMDSSGLGNSGATDLVYNGDRSEANLAYAGNKLCVVTVDSVFGGYSGAKPLNDGFYATFDNHDQDNWATEAWASLDDKKKDHWIQFAFKAEQQISRVIVYWAVDNGSIFSARDAYVEAWIDDEWVKVAEYSWEGHLTQQNSTVFEFDTVTTERIRVVQPKNRGDATTEGVEGSTTYSGLMWVSEVEIYKDKANA
jgi:endo-alpha-1,4-polygalactosaminidase (GH114 family)